MTLRDACADALAVFAPTDCCGCGAPDRSLCPACRGALAGDGPAVSTDGFGIPLWSALDYAGVVRRVLLAYKDGGRTDAAWALALPLRHAVVAALRAAGPQPPGVEVVTIPSTRAALRQRGYHPVDLVLRRAGFHPSRALRAGRETADQAGLDREARFRNRQGTLVAARPLQGRRFLLVDDILTTGATLAEARRAIEAAGGRVVAAATIARTRRRVPVTGSLLTEPGIAGDLSLHPHYGGGKGVDESP